jgi:hypothetical protein
MPAALTTPPPTYEQSLRDPSPPPSEALAPAWVVELPTAPVVKTSQSPSLIDRAVTVRQSMGAKVTALFQKCVAFVKQNKLKILFYLSLAGTILGVSTLVLAFLFTAGSLLAGLAFLGLITTYLPWFILLLVVIDNKN